MNEDGDPTPLQRLCVALQDFVNATDDEAPVLIRGAVFAWESTIIDSDGDAAFKVGYSTAEFTTMAQVIGIVEVAKEQLLRDMLWRNEDE